MRIIIGQLFGAVVLVSIVLVAAAVPDHDSCVSRLNYRMEGIQVSDRIKQFEPFSVDHAKEILLDCDGLVRYVRKIKSEFKCEGELEYNRGEFPTYAKVNDYVQYCKNIADTYDTIMKGPSFLSKILRGNFGTVDNDSCVSKINKRLLNVQPGDGVKQFEPFNVESLKEVGCDAFVTSVMKIKSELRCEDDYEIDRAKFPTYAKIDGYVRYCEGPRHSYGPSIFSIMNDALNHAHA